MTQRLLYADVHTLARALMATTPKIWRTRATEVIEGAEVADLYRRRFGQCHPVWGDGTVEAAARRFDLAGPAGLACLRYCEAVKTILEIWIARHTQGSAPNN